MSVALPIKLITGDTGMYPCLITGGTISSAIFAVVVELADGYSYDSGNNCIKKGSETVYTVPEGTYISAIEETETTTKIAINVTQDGDPSTTSNDVTFILDAALTESFKPGKYTYDISVMQTNELVSGEARYTPIYTNAFMVFPKTNKIIVTNQVSS